MEYLNGENLYRAFLSGAREVIRHKEILNKINVFPVADGDTGNNLASTVSFIIEDAKVLEDDIRKLYDKTKQIELGQHPSIKPKDDLNLIRQINLSYTMLIRMHDQCQLLDETLSNELTHLTRHDASKIFQKLLLI